MKSFRILFCSAALSAFSLLSFAPQAEAGVFNLPYFLVPGRSSLGLEPELVLSNGAGLGFNAKYTYGLNDLNNVTAIVGTGTGPRRFRVGGNMTFDFFPDVEGQPGIGIAAQGVYYRLPVDGRFELTGIPYLHKNFITAGNEVDPFLAIPLGMGFSNGTYQVISNVVVGTIFKNPAIANVRFSLELGINVNHSESYISGGAIFYP